MDLNKYQALINKGRLTTSESAELVDVLRKAFTLYQAAKNFVDSEGFQGICDEEVLLEQAVNNLTN